LAPCIKSVVPGSAVNSADLNALTNANSSGVKFRNTRSGRNGQLSQGTRRPEAGIDLDIVPSLGRRSHRPAGELDSSRISRQSLRHFLMTGRPILNHIPNRMDEPPGTNMKITRISAWYGKRPPPKRVP